MITETQIQELAKKLAEKIVSNTQHGLDRYGKTFKPYSTIPFAMPYGAVLDKKKRKQAIKDGKAFTFVGETDGRIWLQWKGGYKEYRGLMGYQTQIVDLTLSGNMLKDLGVIGTQIIDKEGGTFDLSQLNDPNLAGTMNVGMPKEITITIGFKDNYLKQLAIQNIDLGRDFVGLNDEDISKVINEFLNNI